MIERVRPWMSGDRWVDVGVGNGALLFAAAEYGMEAIGIDLRERALAPIRQFGYDVRLCDAMDFDYAGAAAVSLADLLEHVPDPRALLRKIKADAPKAAVFISCPTMDCISWKYLEAAGKNMYWTEPEHYHNFTRRSLMKLLGESGYFPRYYGASTRYASCMEVIAS
jgi:2-polyprenyl-3-methyl-5-hydroxy-6-metoxy-1,4-benzoquinol methylase